MCDPCAVNCTGVRRRWLIAENILDLYTHNADTIAERGATEGDEKPSAARLLSQRLTAYVESDLAVSYSFTAPSHAPTANSRPIAVPIVQRTVPLDDARHVLPVHPSEELNVNGPINDSMNPQNDMHDSLSLLSVAPTPVGVALLAMAYRAPLGHIDFSCFLVGPTGVGKSELAALAQQYYGAGMDRLHLPANWSFTADTLRALAHQAKDALLVIDDFAPIGTDGEVTRQHRVAESLLSGHAAVHQVRRARAGTTRRPSTPPRALILGTGEELPRGQSLRGRLLVLAVGPSDVKWSKLTTLQKLAARGLFAASMAGYIRWLAPTYHLEGERVRARIEQLEQVEIRGAHPRTSHMIASLAVGVERFLQFAESTWAINSRQRRDAWEQGWNALLRLGEDQVRHFDAGISRRD